MKRAIFLAAVLLVVVAIPAMAQSTTTLDIDASTITPNLFLGANIILLALTGVMMLVAGLAFGMGILKKLLSAIKGAFGA